MVRWIRSRSMSDESKGGPEPKGEDGPVEGEGNGDLAILVAARNEADRVGETIASLTRAFPGASIWLADDASGDGTAEIALSGGASVVSRRFPHGKGGNVTACADALLHRDRPGLILVCDADLGSSAGRLGPLVDAVRRDECDLAVASFLRRVGGGFGVALGFSRWAIRDRSGFIAEAPISGQRAMRTEVMEAVLPLARGYGLETGMTIDAVRAGFRVAEYEVDLSHRATGKSLGGFIHRLRQLVDFIRAWWERR